MLKAVLFDCDGVLIDSLESTIRFYQDLVEFFGFPRPTTKMVEKYEYLTAMECLGKLVPEVDVKTLKKMIKKAKEIYPNYVKYITASPGIRKILHKLAGKYQLGIVTGRLKFELLNVLRKEKIDNFFVTAIVAGDYQKPKPDPEPLQVALNKLGLKPNEAVYIGDTQIDIDASKAAGMKVIHYGKRKVKGFDYHIDDFSELGAILKNL